jgi:hypothetical protein
MSPFPGAVDCKASTKLAAENLAPIASERLRKIFRGTIIAAGGFEPDTAEARGSYTKHPKSYLATVFRY